MSSHPNSRQRTAMQLLLSGDCKAALDLYPAGESLLATILDHGWIERCEAAGYRITPTGREAFKMPIPIRRSTKRKKA